MPISEKNSWLLHVMDIITGVIWFSAFLILWHIEFCDWLTYSQSHVVMHAALFRPLPKVVTKTNNACNIQLRSIRMIHLFSLPGGSQAYFIRSPVLLVWSCLRLEKYLNFVIFGYHFSRYFGQWLLLWSGRLLTCNLKASNLKVHKELMYSWFYPQSHAIALYKHTTIAYKNKCLPF